MKEDTCTLYTLHISVVTGITQSIIIITVIKIVLLRELNFVPYKIIRWTYVNVNSRTRTAQSSRLPGNRERNLLPLVVLFENIAKKVLHTPMYGNWVKH